ncbi:MAG: tellurium resistance protein TerC [Alphaproteobacteria bacterium]|nr:tellurium resistance protein TerC [Alphaproteobacteria bacterium]MCB9691926.1 tellurium resistance protein TerC [Alphaproteobacteria bacterium]
MLVFLQAVLGIDNLLYISIESQRVQEDKQAMVRKWGIGLAILLRIGLLFVVTKAIELFQSPFFATHVPGVFEIDMNVHSVIVLAGGLFIMYTAFKEIMHMVTIDDLGHAEVGEGPKRSIEVAIAWIVVMNLVFSFDSILSAIALTKVLPVMATAIVISGVLMMVLADRVSDFLKRNRMYEVLGLFILLVVGVMLVSEGAHLAHIVVGGNAIHAMEKSTFYFSIACLVLVDVVQGRYQKKLDLERASQH